MLTLARGFFSKGGLSLLVAAVIVSKFFCGKKYKLKNCLNSLRHIKNKLLEVVELVIILSVVVIAYLLMVDFVACGDNNCDIKSTLLQ